MKGKGGGLAIDHFASLRPCGSFPDTPYICCLKEAREKRGQPLFFLASSATMVTEGQVREIIGGLLEGTDHFIVDVNVKSGNVVNVELDNDKAITLDELVRCNRALRDELEAQGEDVELRVSSPGMGRPFKIERQYQKHVGRVVRVDMLDGKKLEGRLERADGEELELRLQIPSKIKGRKPKLAEESTVVPMSEVKATKATVTFPNVSKQ